MWTCPSSAQAKCGFFEWDDSGDSVNDDRGGGGGSSSTGDCFKVKRLDVFFRPFPDGTL